MKLGRAVLAVALLVEIVHCQEEQEQEEEEEDVGQGLQEPAAPDPLKGEQLRGLHQKMDSDGDGKVSVAEVLSFSEATRKSIAVRIMSDHVLPDLDKDGDGKLSWNEYLGVDEKTQDVEKELHAPLLPEMRRKFLVADENEDGLLEAHEARGLFHPETNEKIMRVEVSETFSRQDADKNGKLSREEWMNQHPPSVGGAASDEEDIKASMEDMPSEMPPNEGEESTNDDDESFEEVDADKDGELTEEELFRWQMDQYSVEEAVDQLYELADKNGDGQITAEELHAAGGVLARNASGPHYHLFEWAEHHEL